MRMKMNKKKMLTAAAAALCLAVIAGCGQHIGQCFYGRLGGGACCLALRHGFGRHRR